MSWVLSLILAPVIVGEILIRHLIGRPINPATPLLSGMPDTKGT